MKHQQIIELMNRTRHKHNIPYMKIVEITGISYPTVRNAFLGGNLSFKNMVNVMGAIGLEINLIERN